MPAILPRFHRWARRSLPAWLALGVAAAAPARAPRVINEVDYDQPGTDTAEFIEIKNVSAATVDLTDYSVELVNGNGGGAAVYQTIPLAPQGTLPSGDFLVICSNTANVPGCDLQVLPLTNLIQNGSPDAVAIRFQGSTLIDTVSYDGVTGVPYTEGPAGAPADPSALASRGISRFPDGADTNLNAVDFIMADITPGQENTSTPVELFGFRVE